MNELHELREKLCDELKEYAHKEMSTGSLDVLDKLTHTIKNLDKVIDGNEGYSGRYPMYDADGRSYAKRDSRGRYSRGDGYGGYAYDDMRR